MFLTPKGWSRVLSVLLLSLLPSATPAFAVPLGDTQGTVTAVRVRPANGSVKAFEVWMKDVQNDRWGCLASAGGYVVVYDNGYGVTPESFKQLFVTALTAQATGKPLALDSSGTSPCVNVNMGWVVG